MIFVIFLIDYPFLMIVLYNFIAINTSLWPWPPDKSFVSHFQFSKLKPQRNRVHSRSISASSTSSYSSCKFAL